MEYRSARDAKKAITCSVFPAENKDVWSEVAKTVVAEVVVVEEENDDDDDDDDDDEEEDEEEVEAEAWGKGTEAHFIGKDAIKIRLEER
jgi:16S rRNA C967 or C1407 C5-methylase (RsmB/RsmF family)